jgi:hypothetical protein
VAFDRELIAERQRVIDLVGLGDESSNRQRVLIPRLRGLEDSSRNWSVWMTVDHLRIVNDGVAGTMSELILGRTPPGAASTAAVKPSPEAGPSALEGFTRSCDRVLGVVAKAGSLRTNARFPHPWFGALDAYGWHAMVSMHMGIHRRQIEAIRQTQSQRPPTST